MPDVKTENVLRFQVGENVILKVSPWKSNTFPQTGKAEEPLLKKCIADEHLLYHMDEIRVYDKLNFVEEPVEIMDREVKRLKQCHIPIVKVRWNSRRGPEFTWEREGPKAKENTPS
ncbi:hypothetical protein Tco_1563547 [Tanacetum coccineum]